MTREEKLQKLKDSKASKDMVIISNGEPFIEVLQDKIVKLKEVLDSGVELNNLDDLLEQLGVLQSFHKEVKDLKESIKQIKFPDNVEVKGLGDLVKATEVLSKKKNPEFKIDEKLFTDITKSIVDLTLKVEEAAVPPKQNQNPEDYVPMRRVVLMGKKLLYDDSFYTGGGGGGTSVPVENGKVPVSISDPITATIDESTLATSAKQDTGNTSLAAIKTDVDTLTTAGGGAYVRQDSTATIAKESGGNLATIATNTSGLATSANQTNATQQTKITNATNIADVIANDAGYNGLVINQGSKVLTFTTSSSGAQVLLANTDVRGYASIMIVTTSVGSGLAWTGQFAPNSGGTYINSAEWQSPSSATAAATNLGVSNNTRYLAPIIDNYFQLNVTALTSGTLSGYVILSSRPVTRDIINVAIQGPANKTNNNAAPAATQMDVMPAIANAAAPSWSEGFSVKQSVDLAGNTRVALQSVATGGYSYSHIAAGQATTTVKSGAGTLHAIIFNGAAAATNVTTIYDNTAASGTVIGIPAATAVTSPTTVIYGLAFGTGLTINTATANGADMTVIYK